MEPVRSFEQATYCHLAAAPISPNAQGRCIPFRLANPEGHVHDRKCGSSGDRDMCGVDVTEDCDRSSFETSSFSSDLCEADRRSLAAALNPDLKVAETRFRAEARSPRRDRGRQGPAIRRHGDRSRGARRVGLSRSGQNDNRQPLQADERRSRPIGAFQATAEIGTFDSSESSVLLAVSGQCVHSSIPMSISRSRVCVGAS